MSSSGKIDLAQIVCPRLRTLALVDPGASTLISFAHQSANICGSQCGDFTTTMSKCRGSWPLAQNHERSNRLTGRVPTTSVALPACSTAVRPESHCQPNDSLRN